VKADKEQSPAFSDAGFPDFENRFPDFEKHIGSLTQFLQLLIIFKKV
jgi:hypothetical protein